MSPDIAALVAESREAQGLPHKVTDPATLRRVAMLSAPNDEGRPPKVGLVTIATGPFSR